MELELSSERTRKVGRRQNKFGMRALLSAQLSSTRLETQRSIECALIRSVQSAQTTHTPDRNSDRSLARLRTLIGTTTALCRLLSEPRPLGAAAAASA